MAETDSTVTVPLWALEFVLDHAVFWDEGPFDEGWESVEMKRATDALKAALQAKYWDKQ